MSTREMAFNILSDLSEEKVKAFITLFGRSFDDIEEEEPDEFDLELIADSMVDNDESMPLEEYISSLGIDINEL